MDSDDLFDVFDEPAAVSNESNEQEGRVKTIDELAEEARKDELQRMTSRKRQRSPSPSPAAASAAGVADADSSDDDSDDVVMTDGASALADGSSSAKARSEADVASVQKNGEANSSSEDAEEAASAAAAQPIAAPQFGRDKCLHEVALPPNYEGDDPMIIINRPTTKPAAKKYPFTLDAFQSESVKCIEAGHSVLVSAHTSAGKTAVAEYAIAMSLRDGSRVIYTSPIKALSNQKFRELTDEFKDVGLMTGDVTINPNSSVLVMTTEILRSMLYRGSEILNEVAWVIFDEVHYMRDKERGVVWEETMILLPNTVKYVFLSATIPNASEFAGWIAKLKGQPVHVVYTDYRPTPLQHYVFPSGGDGILLVVDEKGRFREDNYRKIINQLTEKKDEGAAAAGGKGGPGPRKKQKVQQKQTGTSSDIYKLIKMITERQFQPVIVFSFSRKECENYAMQLSKIDLNDDQEKALVEEVFNNAVESLSEDDRKLPQVEHMLPLLKKGIGIHHSGLLPIMKEVIEILFQEQLVKCLFSTETFSMGLNMPARTVVFTNLKKFDGQAHRLVTPGEYIQMSGRAGRRGLDDRGIVIIMLDKEQQERGDASETLFDIATARKLMSGKADPLNSSFHLSYYMILNLLRVEEITPEYIMERSFFQFQSEKQRPELEAQLQKQEEALKALPPLAPTTAEQQSLEQYFSLREQIEGLRNELRAEITKPIYSLNFLQPGRLVRIRDGQDDWGWGPIINFQKQQKVTETNIKLLKASDYVVDVMLKAQPLPAGADGAAAAADTTIRRGKPKPAVEGQPCDMIILPVQLDLIDQFSQIRLYLNPNLHQASAKEAMKMRLNETLKRFPQGIPLLDPIEDMKIQSKSLKQIVQKIESLEQKLFANKYHNNAQLGELYTQYCARRNAEKDIEELQRRVRLAGQIVLKDDLKKMMRVLRRIGCTDQDNVIQAKGKVACELSTADELVLTEMMLQGVFNDMEPEAVAALLSCLCHEDSSWVKLKDSFRLPEHLSSAFKKLQEAAKRIAKVSTESKIELDEQNYVDSFAPTLMEVTYAWCKGAKFIEIMKMTDQFEGSIIRSMRRLEELLRQTCAAAKSIGDSVLEQKFLKSIELLKRDIVFSSSLFVGG